MKLGHPIISVTDNIESDTFDNDFIRLNLNKPKLWNWKLTTSKSSPNIIFPRIQLVDSEGTILADANEAGCVFDGRNSSRNSSYKSNKSSKSTKKVNELTADSIESSRKHSKNSSYKSNSSVKSSAKTNDLKVESTYVAKENSLPRKKPSQKIKRERSDASINNRHSFRDASSSESSGAEDFTLYEENGFARKPKYIYRTCSAGTLIVCEESFYKYKRRRPKGRKYKDRQVKEVTEEELIKLEKLFQKIYLEVKAPVTIATNNLATSYSAHGTIPENDEVHHYRRSSSVYEREKVPFQYQENSIRKSASSGCCQRNASDRLTQTRQGSNDTVSDEDEENSPRGKRRQLRRKIVRKNTGCTSGSDTRADRQMKERMIRQADGGKTDKRTKVLAEGRINKLSS
ncbi:uncharacterized protein LOC113375117 [Ctenocephalides felis]|uniref:uncharacterized protein LOC113375117 n=1 Tax=Ctenocephalides felis TaxID=7515 RepID=UPI000E6E2F70|nr:uncharacterized protein LOC113375117 [Ctenocephalides felis]